MSTDTAATLEEIDEYQTINTVLGKSWITTDSQIVQGILSIIDDNGGL